MNKIVLMAGATLLAAYALISYRSGSHTCYQDMSATELHDQLSAAGDGALLLDVRTPAEFNAGHVAGARLLPLSELARDPSQLEAHEGQPLYVICRSGNRSAQASRLLCQEGCEEVFNISGGMNSWSRAGFPVVRE